MAAVKEDLVMDFDEPALIAKRRPRPPNIGELIVQAQKAQGEGNYGAALAAVRRAILADPANAAPYAHAGNVLLRLCDPDATLRVLEAGLRRNPNDMEMQDHARQARSQKEAGGHSPEGTDAAACKARALNREGVALAREQRFAEALAKFEEAARTAPGLIPKAEYNAGLALEQLGRPQDAVSRYVAAHKAFVLPEDQLESLGRLVGLAQRARIAVPEGADRRYRLGIVRTREKRYQEAIQELESALAEAPWLVEAYYNLGLVYDLAAAHHEALRALRTYAHLAPNAPNIGTVKTKIVELEERLGVVGGPTK